MLAAAHTETSTSEFPRLDNRWHPRSMTEQPPQPRLLDDRLTHWAATKPDAEAFSYLEHVGVAEMERPGAAAGDDASGPWRATTWSRSSTRTARRASS